MTVLNSIISLNKTQLTPVFATCLLSIFLSACVDVVRVPAVILKSSTEFYPNATLKAEIIDLGHGTEVNYGFLISKDSSTLSIEQNHMSFFLGPTDDIGVFEKMLSTSLGIPPGTWFYKAFITEDSITYQYSSVSEITFGERIKLYKSQQVGDLLNLYIMKDTTLSFEYQYNEYAQSYAGSTQCSDLQKANDGWLYNFYYYPGLYFYEVRLNSDNSFYDSGVFTINSSSCSVLDVTD